MEELIGFVISILMGISLGLMGSGGSILTIPNLVYMFAIPPVLASSYSLLIVGVSSLVGVIPKLKRKEVNFSIVKFFGSASLLGMIVTRKLILPSIPEELTFGSIEISRDFLFMIFFAFLMLFAGISMVSGRKESLEKDKQLSSIRTKMLLLVQGAGVGILSGLFGAGGGFLIIPGLVILAGLSMKQAVASSLFLVVINSFVGFSSDYEMFTQMDWRLLSFLTFLSVIGIYIGNRLSNRFNASSLKHVFGYFIIFVSIIIAIGEMI